MRQDVKLGLAIGGILLAVLIVYVLVVPGDNGASDVQLVDGDPITDTTGGNTLDLTQPAPSELAQTETPVEPTEATTSTDPFESGNTAEPDTSASVAGNAGGEGLWNDLLAGRAELPPMMSETPAPAAANRQAIALPAEPSAPQAMTSSNEPIAPQTASVFDPAATTESPATVTPRAVAATTHVVKSGETLSSISAAVYGSANYYPHIQRANPAINPNRLKVGTTLQIPALTDVRPRQQATQAAATPINSAEQYKVGTGESLYTISIKLYGKADRVTELYEANKATIGPDPAKLKTGTVLTLPEPPTVASR